MAKIVEGILKVNPNAKVVVRGDTVDTCTIEWLDGTAEISKADIKTAMTQVDSDNNAIAYQEKRRSEYPPMADYLDAVVKGDDTAKQKYIDDCKAVKEKYPK